ncbi:SusC/RagA family TonB-linked outer membrane protein [Flavobacterium sp. T12S277]|uniref:SusC/RagA family TonB-linked outer membrane protein n=1 Tax=Flavobacterium sp. T12S277 TaxID=3402752 RepID=UPI003ADD44C0
MKLKKRKIVMLLMITMQITFAQERIVSGVVTDYSGLPIPGVNVLVKDTKNSTQTDIEGRYSIKVGSDQILSFSFVGTIKQEIRAGSEKINVKLKNQTTELDGIVVTALGIKRDKKSLGYATQEVKGGDLTAGTASGNFLNELSGRVAGVQIKRNNNFGGSTNVVSRGVKSLTGNNQMLIVIDGMPINNSNINSSTASQTEGRGGYDYGNAGADINPEDIENINVLKGAAAAALYGWQAGNGVVVITTKKGRSKKGLGVTFSSEVITGVIDKSTFIKHQSKYGGGNGLNSFLKEDVNGDGTPDLVAPTSSEMSFGEAFNPNLMVYQWNAFTPFSDHYGKATPWVNAKNGPITFFETPFTVNNSISVEDGNEKTSFILNYTHYQQTGIMPNSKMNKNSLSAKMTHQFSDKLSGYAYANYTTNSTVGRNDTTWGDNVVYGFRDWWQTNVDIKELKQVYERSGGQNITWNTISSTDLQTYSQENPYFKRYKSFQSDSRNRFLGYVKLDYKILDWLTASAKASTDSYSELREERKAVGSVSSRFGLNRLHETSGYQVYDGIFSEQNYEMILTFKKNINDNISISGLVGGNILRTSLVSSLASTQGGLIVPGLYSLTNSIAPPPASRRRNDNSGVNSTYASASFGYKDFAFVEGTVRKDAFSTLPSGNNALATCSLSGSYVFTKHINQPWLSFGKLRIGYAENPQGNIDLYSLDDTYVKSDPFGTNQIYSIPTTKNNPDLRPVKTVTNEIGLEMQFLEKRIGFDVSVYKSLSTDQIFRVPFSNATGFASKYINAGSVQNKGIELQLNLTPLKTKDFAWDMFVNWSKNENTVVSLTEGIENLQIGAFVGGITINAQPGQPYGVIKGTDFKYLNGQKVISPKGGYEKNSSTNNVIGNITPDWIAGLRNKFTYKQWSLSFLIDIQKGGDLYSMDQEYGQSSGLTQYSAGINDLGNPIRNTKANGGGVILDGVQADGSKNTVRTEDQKFFSTIDGFFAEPHKAFIYDASFVKLREANLTYVFPSAIVSKMKLTGLSFSLIGSNLWIISKKLPDADPEGGLGSGNLSSANSLAPLPTTRNFGFNITVKF